jgi:hypothetical protein
MSSPYKNKKTFICLKRLEKEKFYLLYFTYYRDIKNAVSIYVREIPASVAEMIRLIPYKRRIRP